MQGSIVSTITGTSAKVAAFEELEHCGNDPHKYL
jgi:hypothetical protein